jgi:hypothetical protein
MVSRRLHHSLRDIHVARSGDNGSPAGTDRTAHMSMKKTDLEKQLAKKLAGRLHGAGVPDRFAQGAALAVDRREQRRLDAAAGLVPFACKLPQELVTRLQQRAASTEGGLNALVADLLRGALDAK